MKPVGRDAQVEEVPGQGRYVEGRSAGTSCAAASEPLCWAQPASHSHKHAWTPLSEKVPASPHCTLTDARHDVSKALLDHPAHDAVLLSACSCEGMCVCEGAGRNMC